MHILYFHQHFTLPTGNGGIRSYQNAKELIQKGYQVTMVCGSFSNGNTGLDNLKFKKGKRTGIVDGINIIEFELPYSNSTKFSERILIFLKFAYQSILLSLREDYDILFATSTPLTSGLPGVFSKIFRRKKFIFEVRDLWPELPYQMGIIKSKFIYSVLKLLEIIIYKSSDAIIGLSPGICEGIKLITGDSKEIKLIPNGCDIQLFKTYNSDFNGIKNEKDQLNLIFAGSHGMANGLDALIPVAIELKNRKLNHIKIILIGNGSEKNKLIHLVEKHGVESYIIFLDPVPKKELVKILAKMDMGLQILKNIPAFYYGTSPNKFFDYLSAGLPVLTNYPGWVSNLITEYNCGISVNPDAPEKFCDALELIYSNKSLLIEYRENSKKLAQQFDREKLTSEWTTFITK